MIQTETKDYSLYRVHIIPNIVTSYICNSILAVIGFVILEVVVQDKTVKL